MLCVTVVSCRKYKGFERSSGFYYQYHIRNENGLQPEIGDFVMVNMAIRVGDTMLSPMTQNNMLVDDLYRGDIYSALRQMHLGDSATFIFDGEDFYEKFLGMGDYPYGNTPIYADIKLLKVMKKENLENAENLYTEQRKELRAKEDSLVRAYANEHQLNTISRGIYYTINRKGNGIKAKKNNTVEVLYRAYRMDNTEFDRRLDPAKPRSFEVGMGQVARGLDVIVQEMNEGDQITVIFPSSLAFGDNGSAEYKIPPFTPVVFDIELVKVRK